MRFLQPLFNLCSTPAFYLSLFFKAPVTVISLMLSLDALSDTAAEIESAIPSAAKAVVVIITADIVSSQKLFSVQSIACIVTFYSAKHRSR